MAKTKVAIIGSGNIGTDLMIKVMRLSNTLEMGAFVGAKTQLLGQSRRRSGKCLDPACSLCRAELARFLAPLKQPFPAPLWPRPLFFARMRRRIGEMQARGLGLAPTPMASHW